MFSYKLFTSAWVCDGLECIILRNTWWMFITTSLVRAVDAMLTGEVTIYACISSFTMREVFTLNIKKEKIPWIHLTSIYGCRYWHWRFVQLGKNRHFSCLDCWTGYCCCAMAMVVIKASNIICCCKLHSLIFITRRLLSPFSS